jgi:pimeloyl-ACP methyl ester carboxylesterase
MLAVMDSRVTLPSVRHVVIEGPQARIACEDWGNPECPPMILIMGLGAQLLMWPDGFCRGLVDAGLRVIRFDNRDIGRSGRFTGDASMPQLWRLALRAQLGLQTPVPYSLEDMAGDVEALMDGLVIERAHIVGASMGGMIAQVYAAARPQRVSSLSILFSSTNQPLLPPADPALLWRMLKGPGPGCDLAQQKAHVKGLLAAMGTTAYPVADADLDELVERMAERGMDPAGTRRQLMALLGSGDLRRYCERIEAPTLVIHGEEDRMLPKAAGLAVAQAIPGASFELIPGMGHTLPPALWPHLSAMIARHALAARPGPPATAAES